MNPQPDLCNKAPPRGELVFIYLISAQSESSSADLSNSLPEVNSSSFISLALRQEILKRREHPIQTTLKYDLPDLNRPEHTWQLSVSETFLEKG